MFLEKSLTDNLDRLFRLHQRELQQIAYRRLGDRDMAADLTQDTFVRYIGLDRQQRTAEILNPRFFLIRVLRNLIIDLGRSRSRRGVVVSLDDVHDELFDSCPGPAELLELRRQLLTLTRALDELPGDCRQALLLNRLDGLSHVAIAERLGISASMVSKHIMRALRHCAQNLGLLDK